MARKKQKTSKVAGFINKLVQIVKSKQNQELISYEQERRCFRIRNVRKFTEVILPKYFKHKNYSSFIRQVNLYSFHKLPSQGKQEIYQQQFFNIDSIRDLKKIKRKLMGSEIKRNQKKSQQESGNSDSQYNCSDDSGSQQSEKQQNNNNNVEKENKGSMEFEIEELQKRKVFIQNKIKLQQQNNLRLQFENKQLKDDFQDQNLNFYADTLNILINLALSQYQTQEISHNKYQILIKYLLEQQKELSRILEMIKDSQQNKIINKEIGNSIENLSQLLTSLKFFIGEQNDPDTIPIFLQNLLSYIQGQQKSGDKQSLESNNYKGDSNEQKQQQNNQNGFREMSEQNKLISEQQMKEDNEEQGQENEAQIKQDKTVEKKKKTVKKHSNKEEDGQYLPNHH